MLYDIIVCQQTGKVINIWHGAESPGYLNLRRFLKALLIVFPLLKIWAAWPYMLSVSLIRCLKKWNPEKIAIQKHHNHHQVLQRSEKSDWVYHTYRAFTLVLGTVPAGTCSRNMFSVHTISSSMNDVLKRIVPARTVPAGTWSNHVLGTKTPR